MTSTNAAPSAASARIGEAAGALRAVAAPSWHPRALVTLGSGLGGLAAEVEEAVAIPYAAVPHMRASTAPGHAGRFLAGRLAGVDVLCMQGRIHGYEGATPQEATFPVRVAHRLGAGTLVVTNAAGGVNLGYRPGQVVAIADHVNLMGANPLAGPNLDEDGPRFPDMTRAYAPRLREAARAVAAARGYDLQEGVYLGVLGPSFETPAEIRAFRALGADLVGMSTVWETIVAAHCGMEVLGLSLVTNMAAGILDAPITHEEVEAAADLGAQDLAAVVRGVLAGL